MLIIKRLTLILEYDNITHNKYKYVLSDFIKKKLNAILQNTLNVNIHFQIQKETIIDKIEINLGTLEINNDFINNFKLQLSHQFKSILAQKINFNEDVLQQCYDKVTTFLCHGIIENNNTVGNIQDYYSYLINSKHNIYNYSVKDFIFTCLSTVTAKERFILNFDDTIIEKTIMLLFKNEYVLCVNMLKQLYETLNSISIEKNNIDVAYILAKYHQNDKIIIDDKVEISPGIEENIMFTKNNLDIKTFTTNTTAEQYKIKNLIANKNLLHSVYLFLLEYYEQFGGIGDKNTFLQKIIPTFTHHTQTKNKILSLKENNVYDKIIFTNNNYIIDVDTENDNINNRKDDNINNRKDDNSKCSLDCKESISNIISNNYTVDDFIMFFSYLNIVAKDISYDGYTFYKNTSLNQTEVFFYTSLRSLSSQLQNNKIQCNGKNIANIIDKINACFDYIFTNLKFKTTFTDLSQENLTSVLNNFCTIIEDHYPILKDYNNIRIYEYNNNLIYNITQYNVHKFNSINDNMSTDTLLTLLNNCTDMTLLFFFIHCINNYTSNDIYNMIQKNIIAQIENNIDILPFQTNTLQQLQHQKLQYNDINNYLIIKIYDVCYLLYLAKEYESHNDKNVILQKCFMLYLDNKRNVMQDNDIIKIINTDKDIQATFTKILITLFLQNSTQKEYIALLEKEELNIEIDMIMNTLYHFNAEQIILFLENVLQYKKTLHEKIYNYVITHNNKNIIPFFNNIINFDSKNNNINNINNNNNDSDINTINNNYSDINTIKNILIFDFLFSSTQHKYKSNIIQYKMHNANPYKINDLDTTKNLYPALIDILYLDKKYFNGYLKNIFLKHFCTNVAEYDDIVMYDNIYHNKNVALKFYVRYLMLLYDNIFQQRLNTDDYDMIISKLKVLEDSIFVSYNLYNSNNKIPSIFTGQNTIGKPILQNADIEQQYVDDDTRIENYELIKKVYILNGGLIFLSPFFKDLFSRLGFLHNETGLFKSFLTQSNAIHTLQYIINKKYSNPEWRMILNKILCGIDYNTNIYSSYVFNEDIKIKKKEILNLKKQCKDIIVTSINTWKELEVLKSFKEFKNGVNVTNFTKYFLERDAMLYIFKVHYKNKTLYKYIMDIASRCYDEDIKTIPWDIHNIFFPWGQNILQVNNIIFIYKKSI